MTHLDLFSGIGGFAYAADQVFGEVEHIFCDNDKFCQQVLKKHWPESEIYDDIRTITADSYIGGYIHGEPEIKPTGRPHEALGQSQPDVRASGIQLLTGGFPCQPFSAAGLRRGTADERHLWPEMLRVIRLTQPTWVIAENVRGLITWNDGLVFEQVCIDLEASGYEVQPFIIPAVAVNAPHRRDRIWFVGHAKHDGQHGAENPQGDIERTDRDTPRPDELRQPEGADSLREAVADTGRIRGEARRGESLRPERQKPEQPDSQRIDELAGVIADSPSPRLERRSQQGQGQHRQHDRVQQFQRESWSKDWHEVATEFCSVDDGLPVKLDGFELSKSQHRKEQLKAYGNAIVPQIAMQIMEAMK